MGVMSESRFCVRPKTQPLIYFRRATPDHLRERRVWMAKKFNNKI